MPLIIDDSNYRNHVTPCGYGLIPRDYSETPYGGTGFAAPFNIATIPEAEWPDRIADRERNKATNYDVWKDTPIGILNQGQLPYCHAFSNVWAIMMKRALMGLPYVELSAGSIGGP